MLNDLFVIIFSNLSRCARSIGYCFGQHLRRFWAFQKQTETWLGNILKQLQLKWKVEVRIIIIQIIDEPRTLAFEARVLKKTALVLSLLVQEIAYTIIIACEICGNYILHNNSNFVFDWGWRLFSRWRWLRLLLSSKLNVLHQDVMNCLKFVIWKM